ncbi:MAG: pilus assembly protein [Oscillospiraceae bacterium]|nr:pilus assembly protein [Oscillospiraceae bacterium]
MIKNEKGQAFVEAAILFPIMIMIFAALVLLSIYLPTRAALQRATQHAATSLATVESDTWIFFDEGIMSHYWETNKGNLDNVYVALLSGIEDVQVQELGEKIVIEIEGRNLSSKLGTLDVECFVNDRIVYREIVVNAVRELPMPVDLSFVGFPNSIHIAVSATAVAQNGDEFLRSMDMAVDFSQFVMNRFGLTDLAGSISSAGARVRELLGL